MKTKKDYQPRITKALSFMAIYFIIIVFCISFANNIQAQTTSTSIKANSMGISGKGTLADPFQITSLYDLRIVSEDSDFWDEHLVLVADIDATATENWNVEDHDNDPNTPEVAMGFEPIGYFHSEPTRFRGSFDGQGHVISNLYIFRQLSSGDHAGLFGSVHTDYFIKNVTVANINFTCNYGGALMSRLHKGDVSNCHSSGQLNASWGGIGGLIGAIYYMEENSSILITDCSSSCNITTISVNDGSTGTIGGLIGEASANEATNEFISIENCTASGEINGHTRNQNVGGMFGLLNAVFIENCTASGDVYGATNIGGFVGYCHGGETMINCHALGKVTNNSGVTGKNNIGGFIAYLGGNTLINNCSATGSEVRAELSTGVGGFVGQCSFGTNTVIKNSYSLANVLGKSDVGGFIGYGGENTSIENCYAKGNVQATDNNIGGFAGRSPKLTVNSVAYGDVSSESGSNLGGFFGRANGNRVENCYAYGEVIGLDDIGGFAGTLYTDTVNNCHAQQNTVVGAKNVGGFCGSLSNLAKVSNCTAEASVVGTGDYIGGFAGTNSANIQNSWASGSASTAGNYVGGFIGSQAIGTSTQCYASGNASGNNNVGGFAGKGNNMVQCFATGSAIGNDYVAGFAGYGSVNTEDCFASGIVVCNGNYGSGFNNLGIIKNSYTSSLINGSGANIGGLVGRNSHSSSLNCYFDSTYNSSLQGSASGQHLNNHKGLLSEQFAYESNFYEWDFNSIWQIETIDEIDFYPRPYHQWYLNNTNMVPFISIEIENQMSDTEIVDNQNSIQIIMPFDYDLNSLALEFELQHGMSLIINGVVQVSGVTINDFSQAVICYFIPVGNKSIDSEDEDQMWLIEVKNDKYQVSFDHTSGGQVLGETLQYINHDFSTTEVLAKSATGYKFNKWVDENGNNYSNDSLLIVENVNGNAIYTAHFVIESGVQDLEQASFKAYPSPCHHTLTVEFDEQYQGKLEIIGVTGKRVMEVNIENTKAVNIDVSSLKQGVYIVKVNGECMKILKQ